MTVSSESVSTVAANFFACKKRRLARPLDNFAAIGVEEECGRGSS